MRGLSTPAERSAYAADWESAIGPEWETWPIVGRAFDGQPIRDIGRGWGYGVKEPGGYVCSPIAYAVRGDIRG